MKARLATKAITTLLVIVAACALSAQAQTAVNGNGGNGNWSASADWSGGAVRNNGGGKTYNVTISNGTAETVTVDLGVTISDLTLGASATLQSSGNNSLTIASGGTFTNNGTLNFNTGSNVLTIQSGGTLNNNAGMTFSGVGSGLNVTGTTTNNSAGSIFFDGGSSSTLTGNVNNLGTFETGFSGGNNKVTVTGTFTNNSGAALKLNATGDAVSVNILNNAGKLMMLAGTTLTVTGGGNGITDVAAGSEYDIGGTFQVKNGATLSNAYAKVSTVEGIINIQNGQTSTVTPNGGTLAVSGSGTFNVARGSDVKLCGDHTVACGVIFGGERGYHVTRPG